jgi:hypothetical protein
MKKSTHHRPKKILRPTPRGDAPLRPSLNKFRQWMEFYGLDPNDYDISELRLSVFDCLESLKELDRADLDRANSAPGFYLPTPEDK